MSHPENSATIEQEILDEELHSPDPNAKDEMQTWMLLEVCSKLACNGLVPSSTLHVDQLRKYLMLLCMLNMC